MMMRIEKLKKEKKIEKENIEILNDIFQSFEFNYKPHSFQTNQGLFFSSIKANPSKFVRKISSQTLSWLRKLKETKLIFLMTSSNADYAKFILDQIFKDENNDQLDYWEFFDICIGDARNRIMTHLIE